MGLNNHGQSDVPDGNDFVAVHGGNNHGIAIREDGSIIAWGRDDEGQCTGPNSCGDSNFVAVAAGSYHSVAMREDGSLVAWGDNSEGQCDVPSGNDFVALEKHFALKSDGSIVVWGDDYYGQVSSAPEDDGYTNISRGVYHYLVMKPACTQAIKGDINGDCKVDFKDLAIMMDHWLECNRDIPGSCDM